ncbi:MAG: hypothetical protein ABI813_08260 [Bacteroidota bacterium]
MPCPLILLTAVPTYQTWLRDRHFFTADKKRKVPDVDDVFRAMKLQRGVNEKIYRTNAANGWQYFESNKKIGLVNKG